MRKPWLTNTSLPYHQMAVLPNIRIFSSYGRFHTAFAVAIASFLAIAPFFCLEGAGVVGFLIFFKSAPRDDLYRRKIIYGKAVWSHIAAENGGMCWEFSTPLRETSVKPFDFWKGRSRCLFLVLSHRENKIFQNKRRKVQFFWKSHRAGFSAVPPRPWRLTLRYWQRAEKLIQFQ